MAQDYESTRPGGTAWPLGLAMALAVGFAIALTAVLSHVKFRDRLSELVESRLEVVLNEVAAPVQVALDLGLSLDEVEGLEDRVRQIVAQDADILGVRVYDSAGTTVASVGLATPSPPAGVVGSWSVDRNDRLLIGTTFESPFDLSAGGIALAYRTDAIAEAAARATDRLTVGGVIAAALGTAFLVAAVVLLIRRALAPYSAMMGAFNRAVNPLVADDLSGAPARIADHARRALGDIDRASMTVDHKGSRDA